MKKEVENIAILIQQWQVQTESVKSLLTLSARVLLIIDDLTYSRQCSKSDICRNMRMLHRQGIKTYCTAFKIMNQLRDEGFLTEQRHGIRVYVALTDKAVAIIGLLRSIAALEK